MMLEERGCDTIVEKCFRKRSYHYIISGGYVVIWQ
jgi:hypothetical protein